MKDDYYQSYVQQLNAEDESQVGDTLQVYKTLKLGKTVYGGGGIYPDIYVHRDTTEYTRYWGELVMRGVMAEYGDDYMDRHRNTMERA